MKKFLFLIPVIIIAIILAICGLNSKVANQTYLRVHIRANSNLEIDQTIKYEVKEQIVNYLTPLLTDGKTFEMAKEIILHNLKNIESIADKVLSEKGFSYTSKVKLNEEYFPTRTYQSLTLESGFYDALIVELGSGTGDNWWCVIYPPLCFTNGDNVSVIYKSKIWEIIQKWLLENN